MNTLIYCSLLAQITTFDFPNCFEIFGPDLQDNLMISRVFATDDTLGQTERYEVLRVNTGAKILSKRDLPNRWQPIGLDENGDVVVASDCEYTVLREPMSKTNPTGPVYVAPLVRQGIFFYQTSEGKTLVPSAKKNLVWSDKYWALCDFGYLKDRHSVVIWDTRYEADALSIRHIIDGKTKIVKPKFDGKDVKILLFGFAVTTRNSIVAMCELSREPSATIVLPSVKIKYESTSPVVKEVFYLSEISLENGATKPLAKFEIEFSARALRVDIIRNCLVALSKHIAFCYNQKLYLVDY